MRIELFYWWYKDYFFCDLKNKVMDNKITLSFDENIIYKAKKYAAANNISVSRLI